MYYFTCISFAILPSGRKSAIKLIDWLTDVIPPKILRQPCLVEDDKAVCGVMSSGRERWTDLFTFSRQFLLPQLSIFTIAFITMEAAWDGASSFVSAQKVLLDPSGPLQSLFGNRCFAAAGPRIWNNFPASLRDKEVSCTEFRRQLKTFRFPLDCGASWLIGYCAL